MAQSPDLESVRQAARALLPGLRERAEKTEGLRRLPEETVSELREAGLFRLLQPARHGGSELGLEALVAASAELGRACGSTAWCHGVLGVHAFMLGLFPAAAQQEVYGASPDALIAACFAPSGTATPAPEGYRLRGRWSFASGCDHAQWIAVSAPTGVEALPGVPDLRSFLVPRSDFRIEDNWFVAGLRGTGSKDVAVDDVLVPAHRTLSLVDAALGRAPGLAANPAPLYRLPLFSVLGLALAGPAVGIARGALEAWRERTRARQLAYTGAKLAVQAPAQIRLAESAAEIDAAEMLLFDACARASSASEPEGELALAERVRVRRDVAFAVRLCTRAVDRLFEAGGAHALFDASPLQRAFRDLHAMSAHAFLCWDTVAELAGRVELGFPPTTPVL